MVEKQRNALLALLVVAVLVIVVRRYLQERAAIPPGGTLPDGAPAVRGEYLFCFWNVENLFDDVDDARKARGDREYDAYFAGDPAALRQKLSNLADVLVGMNAGRGPDVLAVAEVESERAVELLQETLNGRLADPALHYSGRAFADPSGGRNISTALLTRLAVEHDRTRLLGRRQRILETRVRVGSSALVVIAAHWGSRVSDQAGTSRANYADAIYGRFHRLYRANPAVDLLVCGDFNDNPDDASVVDHLHATGDLASVRASGAARLYNPFAALYARGVASHYYGRKGYLFDQVCLSPGLLDGDGWSYVDGSAAVVEKLAYRGRPNRFGGAADKRSLAARGASDHFPVTVRLRVR